MSKICTKCKLEKKSFEFNKKKISPDGFQNICKECSRARSRKYYEDNREKHIKIAGEKRRKYREVVKRYIFEYLLQNPCVNCGESNPVVLEFDHLRDKDNAISYGMVSGWSLTRIKNEIKKCQVLCANCHKIKTAKDQKWFTYTMQQDRLSN